MIARSETTDGTRSNPDQPGSGLWRSVSDPVAREFISSPQILHSYSSLIGNDYHNFSTESELNERDFFLQITMVTK